MNAGKKNDGGKYSPIGFAASRAMQVADSSHRFCIAGTYHKLATKEITVYNATRILKEISSHIHTAVEVISYGAMKYGPGNWKLVENGRRRYSDAFFRHACADRYYKDSPIIDLDSGFTHEAHAISNLILLSCEDLK